VRRLATFLLAAALAVPAAGQCSMCRETAQAQGADAKRSLDLGIIVMFLPAVTAFGGLCWMALRRSD
jgi:hypothetical protein